MNFTELTGLFALPWLAVIMAVLQLVVSVVLAIAVKHDAEKLRQSSSLFLGKPSLWFLVVLFSGGYLAALAYWVIHYSTLRARPNERG